ncbi:MAG: aspartate ammonia-lyase [Paracoccaceae bacterium]
MVGTNNSVLSTLGAQQAEGQTRIESDLLGARDIPASAYWGVHTLRALENFPISGRRIGEWPELIRALAMIKQASALANHELGLLDTARMQAITRACEEIRDGALHDHFVVDQVQGGAGTSTNMNANEVIANRALEIMGHARGDYAHLHPNEHVNLSQSTNDVCPTALKLASWQGVERLIGALGPLRAAFAVKGDEFADVLKMGRTQLQDAVPMTLGQEFRSYAATLESEERSLASARDILCEISLGATAIGTGITTHPDYAAAVCKHLAALSGLPVVTAPDLIEATQDSTAFVHTSGLLRRLAVKLSKISNDLRLLSSGPRAGIGDISLPARQAGSSIMPGKVNPVIPEVVNQIAFGVIGTDVTITMAAEAGQLQLNAFGPVMSAGLFRSLSQLTAGCETLRVNCVEGISANSDALAGAVMGSPALVTALNPWIGYAAATALARDAMASGRDIRELVLERGLLSEAQLDDILSPASLTQPRSLPGRA